MKINATLINAKYAMSCQFHIAQIWYKLLDIVQLDVFGIIQLNLVKLSQISEVLFYALKETSVKTLSTLWVTSVMGVS